MTLVHILLSNDDEIDTEDLGVLTQFRAASPRIKVASRDGVDFYINTAHIICMEVDPDGEF